MCGIIGSYINSISTKDQQESFVNFFTKLKHRGPDYQENINEQLSGGNMHLGFCRLSIQDLSNTANKIFRDENNILLFNGEIYNHKEITNKYFSKVNFETTSDTEVLYNFIKRFGFSKIEELNGMFAIAWIDKNKNKIYLARDRTGVKTLYYLNYNKNFYFSSEAWYLYDRKTDKKINFDALNYYLRYGFNHSKFCIHEDVYKVKPGEIIEFSINNQEMQSKFYIKKNLSAEQLNFEDLDKDIEDSVKLNLISDAKIGSFLSGGLDSSLISVITKKYNNYIEAFTTQYSDISFYEDNLDLNYAKELAKIHQINLNINQINIDDTTKKYFFESLSFFDEPLSNLNILNSYIQARAAKDKGIKVILTGDGADEVFGGYQKYINTKIANDFSFFSAFSKNIKKYKNYNKNYFPLLFFEKLNDNDINFFFKGDIAKKINMSKSHYYMANNENDKNQISNLFDFNCWLTNDHNYKLDRTLMSNSIEGRVPFQSNQILNKYLNYNINKKINYFDTKIQLRKNKILSKQFNYRKKQGWHLPEKWFLENMIKPAYMELVEDCSFVKKDNMINIFNTQIFKKTPVYKIVTLFMLMQWNKHTNLI